MKKELNLKVVTIGTPDISSLPEWEKKVFYSTLLNRILELAGKKENDKEK